MMYLVGDKNSQKRNSWLALCKDKQEAQRVQNELLPLVTVIKPTKKKG